MPRIAIVMISVGDRPWVADTLPGAKAYAKRVGADFFAETRIPDQEKLGFAELPDKPGRPNKIAYAMKSYIPWKYLQKGYSRVLVIDDTCCIRHDAENIFETVPEGYSGIATSDPRHASKSYRFIVKVMPDSEVENLDFDENKYMNSGVVLYDRSAKQAISPDRINEASDLLFASHPHQTLLYYLLVRHEVPLHVFPKSFNSIPALGLPKEERFQLQDVTPYLKDDVNIYHITGGYANRAELIRQVCAFFSPPRKAIAFRLIKQLFTNIIPIRKACRD